MTFDPTDVGPFYLSPEEREAQRYDIVKGSKTAKCTKADLMSALKYKGVRNPKGGMKKLQKLCKKNNIPTTKTIPDIAEGWVNKPKGALQVLYERGWINPSLDPKEYTMKGKSDTFGNRDLKTSLKSLILCQLDFMNQKTMLQYYCEKLGILSDRTPVAHCKIAGEGIEFNWGFAIKTKQEQVPFISRISAQ